VRVIAGEALVLEQQAVQRRDACPHGVSGDAVQTHERLLAQPIEQRQERHRVEMSVLEPRDDERGSRHVQWLDGQHGMELAGDRIRVNG
jgi:hypothetical protein